MTIMQRKARSESADEALRVQTMGGLQGMAKYTVVAIGVCAILHQTWPLFRRQTLAGKAFLVSGAGMTGLVMGAEDKLQRYEYKQKRIWNEERKRVTSLLVKEGSVGSEAEITRYISDQRKLEQQQQALHPSSSSSRPTTPAYPPNPPRFGETETELEDEVLDVLVKSED